MHEQNKTTPRMDNNNRKQSLEGVKRKYTESATVTLIFVRDTGGL